MEEVVPKSDRSVLEGEPRQERNQRLQVELNFHTKCLFVRVEIAWVQEMYVFCFFTFRVQAKEADERILHDTFVFSINLIAQK